MIAAVNRPRILAIDDDPSVLHTVYRVLSPHYEVERASGAAAALEAARTFAPDVAILDVRMPEMDGFELMQRLHKQVADLDVILMTGNVEDPDSTLVRAIDSGAFYFIQKPFERRVLLALAARCCELRRLREESQRYLRRLTKDLEEAQQFQASLLPPTEMRFGGLSICARHLPCHNLAGDFYDYVDLGGKAAALVIADVVGHGTSAAMMTGIVKAAFHAARADGFQPLSVVNRVKEGIRSFDAGRFITLCSARIDFDARRLEYASAGHEPLIVSRANSAPLLLESTGPLISSALTEMPCRESGVNLETGDRLLFYTDGVTEAEGPSGWFGRDRVVSQFDKNGVGGSELLDRILNAVADFSGGRAAEDDMTLLMAELTEQQ